MELIPQGVYHKIIFNVVFSIPIHWWKCPYKEIILEFCLQYYMSDFDIYVSVLYKTENLTSLVAFTLRSLLRCSTLQACIQLTTMVLGVHMT